MKMKVIAGIVLSLVLVCATPGWAQESPMPLTLEESIRIALERNWDLQTALEGIKGAGFRSKAARADFFAKWTGQYGYTRNNDAVSIESGVRGVAGGSRDVWSFGTALNQPLFTGFAISSNYELEQLGVDISKMNVETVRRDIVFQVRSAYFNILRTEKFVEVGIQAVKLVEAQLEISKAFFEVGLVAKNDVLQAEVRLANGRQALVGAENEAALAKSSFNTLLRRPVDTPVKVVDILQYRPFRLNFQESAEEALLHRPEIRASELSISQAREAIKIAQSEFYPTISVQGNYGRVSNEAYLNGDQRSDRWSVQSLATFTLFDWGKTFYKVGESKVKLNQAENAKNRLIDQILLEVKQAHLEVVRAEKNIGVAEKSIEQAEENVRMNEERYKYQVATQTDVLDAVTLLAQAQVNYYSALSEFNIAKAALDRAVGRMVVEMP